jgi:hypothetical protein
LLLIKEKLQKKLNSRSMNKKYIACCTCDNISKLTWEYIKSMLPNEVVKKHVAIKHVYLNNDESVIEKA